MIGKVRFRAVIDDGMDDGEEPDARTFHTEVGALQWLFDVTTGYTDRGYVRVWIERHERLSAHTVEFSQVLNARRDDSGDWRSV